MAVFCQIFESPFNMSNPVRPEHSREDLPGGPESKHSRKGSRVGHQGDHQGYHQGDHQGWESV